MKAPVAINLIEQLATYRERFEEARSLAPRHLQVLRLVGNGRRNKQIATDLGISIKTVEMHRAELMKRLGAKHTADLVKFALVAEVLDS